jgi:prepilin-type N-terminal cleavage/methylation domain-containing protein
MKTQKGFTLVELVITIAIVGILSTVVLFSVVQYVNKSKDANIVGNLAILVSSGEVYYNSNQNYDGFCASSVVTNAFAEMPKVGSSTYACVEGSGNDSWAAYAQMFANDDYAYCVDSRGVKRRINWTDISSITTTTAECPSAAS